MTPPAYLDEAKRALSSAHALLHTQDGEGACNRAYSLLYQCVAQKKAFGTRAESFQIGGLRHAKVRRESLARRLSQMTVFERYSAGIFV